MFIISTTELQRNIGEISKKIASRFYTVIKRGKPKMVILPYFDNNENIINEYLEEYEMQKNTKKLKKELRKSKESGLSNLKI